MKNFLTITLTCLLVLMSATAFADRRNGQGRHVGYVATQGERINRHLEIKSNRTQQRFEHKALRTEAARQNHMAERFRTKGMQIGRHLDLRGDRIHDRYNRPLRHHVSDRRHVHLQPSISYRNHASPDAFFNLTIRQPGLWLGWGWHD